VVYRNRGSDKPPAQQAGDTHRREVHEETDSDSARTRPVVLGGDQDPEHRHEAVLAEVSQQVVQGEQRRYGHAVI
jgi:hypothetical protein